MMDALFEQSKVVKRFNIRVYGITCNQNQEVLLCTEQYKGRMFTKFPGGGLEFGEGVTDCLRREFREELNTEILTMEHFYTTEFFQQSAFSATDQVIAIYYKVTIGHDINEHHCLQDGNALTFFRKAISELCEEDVTFPIDKLIISKIRN